MTIKRYKFNDIKPKQYQGVEALRQRSKAKDGREQESRKSSRFKHLNLRPKTSFKPTSKDLSKLRVLHSSTASRSHASQSTGKKTQNILKESSAEIQSRHHESDFQVGDKRKNVLKAFQGLQSKRAPAGEKKPILPSESGVKKAVTDSKMLEAKSSPLHKEGGPKTAEEKQLKKKATLLEGKNKKKTQAHKKKLSKNNLPEKENAKEVSKQSKNVDSKPKSEGLVLSEAASESFDGAQVDEITEEIETNDKKKSAAASKRAPAHLSENSEFGALGGDATAAGQQDSNFEPDERSDGGTIVYNKQTIGVEKGVGEVYSGYLGFVRLKQDSPETLKNAKEKALDEALDVLAEADQRLFNVYEQVPASKQVPELNDYAEQFFRNRIARLGPRGGMSGS